MSYAIIQTPGKQYRVREGEEILIDRVAGSEKEVTFPILLLRSEKEIVIGNPFVAHGKVSGKIIEEVKGKKIKVSKFKAKVRYDKTIGFRPLYSKVRIEKITLEGKALSQKPKAEKKTTKK